MADDIEDDDFDEEKKYSQYKQEQSKRKETPVLDNFSTTFKSVVERDIENGITYLHRENEINLLLKIFLKKEKQHVAIIGENGTGRETLLKLASLVVMKGDTSVVLDNLNFLYLNLNSLIAGAKYKGQVEERVNAIVREIELSKNQFVLLVKDFWEMNINGNELAAPMAALLRSKAKIIMIFTSEMAEKFFTGNNWTNPMFNIVKINPTNKVETTTILRNHKQRFYKNYSVEINDALIEEVIEYSNLYFPDELQPQKSLSLLEEVCATVELKRISNPSDVIYELKEESDLTKKELEGIFLEKKDVLNKQDFEKAASLRDLEKQLQLKIDQIRIQIGRKSMESRVVITQDELIETIQKQTGIDRQKIRDKEKLIVKKRQFMATEYSGLPQFEFLQAQSVLHGHQISIKGGVAFVLIPHNVEFDELFYHHIKPAMEVHGLTVLKADNIFKPGNILSQVWAQIRTAEVIVADVSGKNSNVIFELGLCYGIQRCPILLTRNPDELPFNIRNLRYIQYENTITGSYKLAESLKTMVGEFLSAVRTDNY